jgi:hypothetical protein
VRWLAPVVAILVGAGLALWLATRFDRDAAERERIAGLERQVQQLAAKAEAAAILRQAEQGPPLGASTQRSYTIACQAPWQELGPVGQALWGCRTPEPMAGGFFPNCALTTSRIPAGLSAEQYYEHTRSRSAQLSAARRLGGRAIVLHGRPAYEASFEQDTTGTPLRVLASMLVDDEQIYAITCTAPPDSFDAVTAHFREIVASFQLQG